MNKLEKSVRHELAYYGPRLRAGGYYLRLGTSGDPPKVGYFRKAFATLEDGICAGIRLYVYQEAMEADDYYRRTVDITESVDRYLDPSEGWTWDDLVAAICDTITAETTR